MNIIRSYEPNKDFANKGKVPFTFYIFVKYWAINHYFFIQGYNVRNVSNFFHVIL